MLGRVGVSVLPFCARRARVVIDSYGTGRALKMHRHDGELHRLVKLGNKGRGG